MRASYGAKRVGGRNEMPESDCALAAWWRAGAGSKWHPCQADGSRRGASEFGAKLGGEEQLGFRSRRRERLSD